MGSKVSIIVPIYKVEAYIHRCLESIQNQTYRNLEIILVNDGSPDRCGEIISEYASKDPRIRVFHKSNGGLSDARNYGMRYATGEFTMFVDSDDWVSNQIVEVMLAAERDYQADIVQASFYYAYDDYWLYDHRFVSDEPIVIRDPRDLMAALLANEKIKNFAWGKLFRTDVIRDIPFEHGVLFEDIYWMYQVVHRVKSYVIMHVPLYYYYQRDDSIVAQYNIRNLDMIRGLKERHRFIEQHYGGLIHMSYKEIMKASLIHYTLLIANWKLDHRGRHRNEIRNYIRTHYDQLKRATEDDETLRTQLALFNAHPLLYIAQLGCKKVLRRLRFIPRPAGLKKINLKGSR